MTGYTYRSERIKQYIEHNYPHGKIVNYKDPDSHLTFYSDDQLSDLDADWFPLCAYRDDDSGKLMYGGRSNIVHTYTEGETGAGKTTRFVMQSIRALSKTKNKPSFVIIDIHGEIVENLYCHLKQMGYNIKILNCDNPDRSDTYNPFRAIAEDCYQSKKLSIESSNNLRRIAEVIQPVESKNDPIWEQGARSYTYGQILDKCEDVIDGKLHPSCMTIYNIIKNHFWIRENLAESFITGDISKIPHYKNKGITSGVQKMICVTNNAERTRDSYFGVIENHYDKFGQEAMYKLSSNSTIDIEELITKPTAIVIQSGSTSLGDNLISLMMNDIYTMVVKKGKENNNKLLSRKIHCFLDEFANCNIASGAEFTKMLTTSRKFGMYWHMILQCDAQLDRKFDSGIGKIIRANSTEIFLGSHDYDTEIRFAKSFGRKTIESIDSEINQGMPNLVVVDVMTPEQLNLTEKGYLYINSNREHMLMSYIEAFYNCPEFERVDDIDTIYPYNDFDYKTTCCYPSEYSVAISKEEFRVLMYIGENAKDISEVSKKFDSFDAKRTVLMLRDKGLVKINGQKVVPNLGREELDKLNARYSQQYQTDEVLDNEEMVRKTLDNILKLKSSDFTCIPEDLFIFMSNFAVFEVEYSSHLDYDDKYKLAREIFCEFLVNHNYKTLDKWKAEFKNEYNRIIKCGYLPSAFVCCFDLALSMMYQDDISLNRIQITRRYRLRKKKLKENLCKLNPRKDGDIDD